MATWMKALSAIVILLCASSALATQPAADPANADLMVRGFPGLPPEARQVVERLAACAHLAGEFNGNRSERDKDVADAMAGLHCDTIEQDVSAIRRKYADDPSVQGALVAASRF